VPSISEPPSRSRQDTIDAEAAARAFLPARAAASNGQVDRIRLFKLPKASAVKARTQAINQLEPFSNATTRRWTT
jgi:transposase